MSTKPFKVTLPGMRIVKTGLCVAICLILGLAIGYPMPIYACIAAILATRPTLETSFRSGLDRLMGTVVGGALAIGVLFFDLSSIHPYLQAILIGLGCAATLYFCVLIRSVDAAALSCVIFLIIVSQHPQDKYLFAATRVLETLAGILISIGVNKFVNIPRKRAPAEEPPEDDAGGGIS
ncbi:MAG: aromatic acid exporter family protein [Oscillospiraceae bacterium]|nr:aromatic acid exporter family protein [Oscillospiraceae bacterium]